MSTMVQAAQLDVKRFGPIEVAATAESDLRAVLIDQKFNEAGASGGRGRRLLRLWRARREGDEQDGSGEPKSPIPQFPKSPIWIYFTRMSCTFRSPSASGC